MDPAQGKRSGNATHDDATHRRAVDVPVGPGVTISEAAGVLADAVSEHLGCAAVPRDPRTVEALVALLRVCSIAADDLSADLTVAAFELSSDEQHGRVAEVAHRLHRASAHAALAAVAIETRLRTGPRG